MNNTLKKPNNLVPIPEHLTPETQAWVAGIREKFVLESHHDRLLILAAEASDRYHRPEQSSIRTAWSLRTVMVGSHHTLCVQIERDSRSSFVRIIRELGLDLAEEPARPPTTQPRHHRG